METIRERTRLLVIAMAVGLVLALLLFRTFAFNHRQFDNSGGGVPIRVGPESNSAGDPAQGAGEGDVGATHDHP